MEDLRARHIIETLRSGVPSRIVSKVLTVGRKALLERCRTGLKMVAQGTSEFLIVDGPYGSGKSHFISAVDNIAREKGFAVSSLVISKETPFNRIHKVYEAAAHAVSANDLPRYGFEDILMRLHPRAENTQDIKDYCEGSLHLKLYYVYDNYLREGDLFKRSQLYDDLAGKFLPLATLKAMHRTNFGEALRIPRFLWQDSHDYFRFLSFLLRRNGYKGWVILLDEAELISKLSIGARAQTYLNLGFLLGLDTERKVEGIFTVLAMASPFIEEALLGTAPGSRKHDLLNVPKWLCDPRRNRESDVNLANQVMHTLINKSESIGSLTQKDTRNILRQIEKLHCQGYRWNGQLDLDFVINRTLDRPIRTSIRVAVEYLDLSYKYGKPPTEIKIDKLYTGSFEEDNMS